jgi:hypothetical protein
MIPKFKLDQRVTTSYFTDSDILVVKGINTNGPNVEYWLEGDDGGRETYPETSLKSYFNPKSGEYYTSDGNHRAIVRARVTATNGTDYILYEFPSWDYDKNVMSSDIASSTLEKFEKGFPNLTPKNFRSIIEA